MLAVSIFKMEQDKCKRCGLCCMISKKIDNKLFTTNIKCPFLVRLGNKKTACKIYSRRLDQDIGHGNKCTLRENMKVNFPGCPYNRPEWNMIKKVK